MTTMIDKMLKIDIHEPTLSESMLGQVIGAENVITVPLNNAGYADYVYFHWTGELEQVERKQADEVLSSLEDCEYQLADHIFQKPEGRLVLLVEGIPVPTPTGIQTLKEAVNGRAWYKSRHYNYSYQKFEKWKADLERKGVLIWITANYMGTVNALAALYNSAQYRSGVLERHLKVQGVGQPKPEEVKEEEAGKRKNGEWVKPWKPNPYVQTLIQMPGNGFGVELAERAIDAFGTTWDVVRQEPEVLAEHIQGVGVDKARQLLRAVGREV